jgi:hypothetical protein
MTSENAQREIAILTRLAADTRLTPTERAQALLTAHQRFDARSCLCGWDELGKSHAAHQADELARMGLLVAADHHARLAADCERCPKCGQEDVDGVRWVDMVEQCIADECPARDGADLAAGTEWKPVAGLRNDRAYDEPEVTP